MKLQSWLAYGLGIVACLFGSSMSASAKTMNGREVFLKHRCNICHSVNSLDIKAVLKEKGARDEAPDLSNAADLIPNEEWVESFLEKKETKDGKKHPMKFKGGDKQMTSLVDWLLSLKTGTAAEDGGSP
jgi:mono/diheme cytochrome c family protein